jgi:hypothetical protein
MACSIQWPVLQNYYDRHNDDRKWRHNLEHLLTIIIDDASLG